MPAIGGVSSSINREFDELTEISSSAVESFAERSNISKGQIGIPGEHTADYSSLRSGPSRLPESGAVSFLEPQYAFDQADIENKFPKLVGGDRLGFCEALSSQWVINSHAPGASSPARTFLSMKSEGESYFKQILGNQQGLTLLRRHGIHPTTAEGSLNESLSWLSQDKLALKPSRPDEGGLAGSGHDYTRLAKKAVNESPLNSAFLSLSLDEFGSKRHLIAAIKPEGGDEWNIFDPNAGLYSVTANDLNTLISNLWGKYRVVGAEAFSIERTNPKPVR
jgi:hypothetical protein